MGILDRVSRLVRANVNDLVDRAEDPEKMIDQILRDMQSNIATARAQVAAMIAQEKELEADLEETRNLSNEWAEKARRAVAAGKDDLARQALRRKRDNDENAAVYEQTYQSQKQTVEKLKQQLGLLESKYQTTLSQRDSLVARQRRAQASTRVTEFTSSLSPLDAGSELDRMERKIRSNEAQVEALSELGTDSFDAQFRELDYDVDIEQELEALKGGPSSISGQLGAGSSSTSEEADSTARTRSSSTPQS